jgi:hypothetical protein
MPSTVKLHHYAANFRSGYFPAAKAPIAAVQATDIINNRAFLPDASPPNIPLAGGQF